MTAASCVAVPGSVAKKRYVTRPSPASKAMATSKPATPIKLRRRFALPNAVVGIL
ncbi:MAG: hypothetical protein WBE08_04505 [Methyloceanibacter sp.]